MSIVLRDIRPDDVAALHAIYGDVEVCAHMSFGPRTLEQCRAIVERSIAESQVLPRTVYFFAAEDDGDVVGVVRLGLLGDGIGELGRAVRRDRWRQGIGAAMAAQVITLGFEELTSLPSRPATRPTMSRPACRSIDSVLPTRELRQARSSGTAFRRIARFGRFAATEARRAELAAACDHRCSLGRPSRLRASGCGSAGCPGPHRKALPRWP